MGLIVSSLSPHYLHLLFCRVLSILALTELVVMALFCAAIKRDSVSLLRFSFLIHVQVFSCKISLACRLKCPYSCFSSHFCFLVIFGLLTLVLLILSLVAAISLSPRFFYIVFLSLYRDIDVILNTGVFFHLLFSTHTVCQHHLWDVRYYYYYFQFLHQR